MARVRTVGAKQPPRRVAARGRKATGKQSTRTVGGKAAASARGVSSKDDVRVSELKLPTARKSPLTALVDFSVLLYARPKFGKTTFFSTFPDALFLTTEPGTKGIEIFEFNADGGGVTDWSVMLQAVKLLERSKRFKNVVIDTADEAYALCSEHVCKRAGLEHPHDANDYGKTWNKISRQFRDALFRIQRTGRGLYLTSHVKESTIDHAGGGSFTRIAPSLTGQAEKTILAFVDMIWYGEIVQDQRRLILTDGDDLVTAGSRKRGLAADIPPAVLLPEDEAQDYNLFAAAFRGEVDGAEARDIRAARTASKAVAAALLVAAHRGKEAERSRS